MARLRCHCRKMDLFGNDEIARLRKVTALNMRLLARVCGACASVSQRVIASR